MSDLVAGEGAATGTESAKRNFFATGCNANAHEFYNRTEALRTRLESLEESLSHRKRRPEEDYRFEKLVSQSLQSTYPYEKLQSGVGRPLPAPLSSDGPGGELSGGVVLGKRIEAPHLVSLINRQKRPLLHPDRTRLNPCIRNLSNGTGATGNEVRSIPETSKER